MRRSTPKVHWGTHPATPATGTTDHPPHIAPPECAFTSTPSLMIARNYPVCPCGHQIHKAYQQSMADLKRTCKLRVDSSSLMPPLRKWMPGTAGGMLRSIVRTVYLATSCGGGVGTSSPAARCRYEQKSEKNARSCVIYMYGPWQSPNAGGSAVHRMRVATMRQLGNSSAILSADQDTASLAHVRDCSVPQCLVCPHNLWGHHLAGTYWA